VNFQLPQGVVACNHCRFGILFSDWSDALLLQMEHCRRNQCGLDLLLSFFFVSRQWSLLNRNLFANADLSPPLRFTHHISIYDAAIQLGIDGYSAKSSCPVAMSISLDLAVARIWQQAAAVQFNNSGICLS
jgi:hypothetical protein